MSETEEAAEVVRQALDWLDDPRGGQPKLARDAKAMLDTLTRRLAEQIQRGDAFWEHMEKSAKQRETLEARLATAEQERDEARALKRRYAEWIVREVKKGPHGDGITAEELPAFLQRHHSATPQSETLEEDTDEG